MRIATWAKSVHAWAIFFSYMRIEAAISSRFFFYIVTVRISGMLTRFLLHQLPKSLGDGEGIMLAKNNNPHQLLQRALTEPPDTYRRWIRPADIIEQSLIEQHKNKPLRLADLLRKLARLKSKG